MMMRARTSFVLAACVLLAACAASPNHSASQAAGGLNFSYVVENGKGVGLVRAFDDGERMVLQFIGDVPAGLLVFGLDGRPISIERVGQHAVLPGLRERVRVQIGAVVVVVSATQRLAPMLPAVAASGSGGASAVAGPASAVAGPAASSSELAVARSDLWFAEQKLTAMERAMKARGGRAPDPEQVASLRAKIRDAAAIIRKSGSP